MPPLVSFSVSLSFFFFPSIFSSHLPPLNNNLYCLVLTCLHLSEIPNAQMHRKQHIFILHERNWFSLTLAQLFKSLKNGTHTTSNKPIMFSAQPTHPPRPKPRKPQLQSDVWGTYCMENCLRPSWKGAPKPGSTKREINSPGEAGFIWSAGMAPPTYLSIHPLNLGRTG